jgi:hypothetical protein
LSFPPEGQRPRRPPRARGARSAMDRQAIMARRAVAAGAALVVLILLVLGVRGCLNARKDEAFRDYAADIRALVRGSSALSARLFEALSTTKRADALDIQNEINAQSTDAEQLVERAKDTDHPDELNAAQQWVVLALELRRDALNRIALRMRDALGDRGRKQAIGAIAGQMQALLASDVIYSQRAIPDLRSEFADRDISERFPISRILPNLGWLDPDTVESRLSRVGAPERAAAPGVHGTGVQGVTAKPPGTVLTEDGVNRIPLSDQLAFEIRVQNQGESEETDIGVSVTISDGREISVDQTISRIAAGDSQAVSIPITRRPPTDAVTEVAIEVAPVPGERVRDNNRASYQVVFSEG